MVELFKHPHLLLLQEQNSIYKLPGGRLRRGESGDIDCLKRKLSSKLSAGEDGRGPEWEVGECLGIWWRPDFEALLYPYMPPNIKRPKECTKLFLVKLPASRRFIVPKNSRLLAIPLCQLHDNETYGPIISAVPHLLSRFTFKFLEP
ncbi:Pre-mRNA cleavage factor Im 25 kDa subunit 1 [Orobanche minor]